MSGTGDLNHDIADRIAGLQKTMDRCMLVLCGGLDPESGLYREGLIGRIDDLARRVSAIENGKHQHADWLRSVAFLGIGAGFGKVADWFASHFK